MRKKIALLTAKDLEDHVVDEDLLEKALSSYKDLSAEYVIWDDPKINWSDYDLVVIRTTWDYTKVPDLFLKVLKDISESGAKLFNPYDLVAWNINKAYLKELSDKGVSTVESFYFDEESFLDELKSLGRDKFVIKPRVGASAEGVKVVDLAAVEDFYKNQDEKNKYFVQPYVEEIHQGELSYFFFDNKFKYAIRKTPKIGDFRVQEEHGGVITVHNPDEEELQKSIEAVEAVKNFSPLYLRVDAVMTKDKGWRLMELEAIEPSMFFRVVKSSAKIFAEAIVEKL